MWSRKSLPIRCTRVNQVVSGVRVARSIVLCVMFYRLYFVPLFLLIWPLYCLSFSFGHCIVCPSHLVIVLSVLLIWPLYCLSFSFGHCIVCPSHLVIVLSVLRFKASDYTQVSINFVLLTVCVLCLRPVCRTYSIPSIRLSQLAEATAI